MSQAQSPSTDRPYGLARVLSAWNLSRSTFYYRKKRASTPKPPQRRGPKTKHTDDELVVQIRDIISSSPFHGEGHRKLWARLRDRGFRTSMARALRLMREHQLLAPQRRLEPAEVRPHDGTIVTERPNQMWGIDGTATHTIADGQVTVFAAIDHCSADCIGIHAAKPATRFEALEPLRQGVKQYCTGFHKGAASGIKLRHDHGSQFMSDDFQNEIRFLGMESSPAFVRQPEGNGCIERFFRTLKEQLLWVRTFQDLDELQAALREFRDRYNREWLIARLGFQSPQQARERLLALQAAA